MVSGTLATTSHPGTLIVCYGSRRNLLYRLTGPVQMGLDLIYFTIYDRMVIISRLVKKVVSSILQTFEYQNKLFSELPLSLFRNIHLLPILP